MTVKTRLCKLCDTIIIKSFNRVYCDRCRIKKKIDYRGAEHQLSMYKTKAYRNMTDKEQIKELMKLTKDIMRGKVK